jgi:hypothetical protein
VIHLSSVMAGPVPMAVNMRGGAVIPEAAPAAVRDPGSLVLARSALVVVMDSGLALCAPRNDQTVLQVV